jgi:chromosome segregation ATPase
VKKDNELLKNKIMSNEKKIMEFKNKGSNNNEDLDILNKEIDNLKNENMALKSNNEKLTNQLKNVLDNNNINNINSINENKKDDTIKKQNEEIEGFKQLVSKLQKEREKNDDVNNTLKRENEKIKNQLIRLSKTLPEEYNELQKQYKELESKYYQNVKNKNSINSTPQKNVVEEQLTKELNLAKKEIDTIKKKNSELIKQLEEKEIKKNCYDNKSEDGNKSNYEEEFDLRKMAKGARDKNRSQDINIDYPGVQAIKGKYRELDFFYNSLETLVKKLLLTIQCNPKNKTYVTEICRIVGFDTETTNKIVTNKNKKNLLGLFTK